MRDLEQLPPQNLEAEQAVLGCQILGGKFGASKHLDQINLLPEVLSVDDFYSDVHQEIQRAIWRLKDKIGVVDVLLLADELESTGKYAEVGGTDYLMKLIDKLEDSTHSLHYAAMVTKCSRRRKSIDIGNMMIRKAYDPTRSDEEFISEAHEAAMKMAEMLHVKKSHPRFLSEHVNEQIDGLERGDLPVVFYGIKEIDGLMRGMAPGELIVVGARPNHGKSALALQWLDAAAAKGVSSLMISEEMSAQNIASRTLTYVSELPSSSWKEQIDNLRLEATSHFSRRAGVLIAENCGTIAACERAIDRAVQSHGIKIVAVDYAQMIDGDGETKAQRVGDVSKRLKKMATKHGINPILLAQLNRGVETRDDLTPRSSDLKDSGSLEEDADIVLLPYVPAMFDETYSDKTEYRIICTKNRSRPGRGEVIQMKTDFGRQRIVSVDTTTGDGRVYDQRDVDRFF
jgi:replicative DNA helicase